MIRVLIVCSWGMSTSLLVDSMLAAAEERKYELVVEALSAGEYAEKVDACDVVLIAPQIRHLRKSIEKLAASEGKPMALNPLMMIPFVLVPVVIVTINYFVFAVGLVHVTIVIQPFTVPLGISGFVATDGDIRGSLLQFFDLAVYALIYFPFYRAWERILVTREEDASQHEAVEAPTPVKVG